MFNELSKYATKFDDGIRIIKEEEDFRNPFFRDIDRILYSLSYLRYSDKTQVFSFEAHAHVIKRAVHVQYVSKIARTIGRELNLNEDLIEASALAHDVGHTPFGHVGEKILNKISLENNVGYFKHNVHSVRVLNSIEKYGEGLNLNYQVLDAVLCHNGEILCGKYVPKKKSMEEFLKEYELCYKEDNVSLVPSTLEGCVVRISDIIAYVGKDFEDGVRLGVIKKEDLPSNIVKVLGSSNREIINTLINDIINNSKHKNYIMLSDEVYKALFELKKFNYKNIYCKSYSSIYEKTIEKDFYKLFNYYLKCVKIGDEKSSIVNNYLSNMNDSYKKNSAEQIVIDYIAGMTDSYFKNQVDKLV